MNIAQASRVVYGNEATSASQMEEARATIRDAAIKGWKFSTNGNASLAQPNTKHAYQMGCVAGTAADTGRLPRVSVEVHANNRAAASRVAERAGFYVCDCNMIG